ncbi:RSP_2648 family PIN domain-containing protein [Pseudooceanicola marinus]|uniref:RSP_2648 family PIN domain-containing protein n=1 Tax=Pseudooceanicola marinus TaxID=396013 RepID=UPI001CD1C167|nr:PIN domain-containing protein [Pseudooceanicola marinus]MCA1334159.1 PIN domain-containing protein [Pseudooceanicola marinus]
MKAVLDACVLYPTVMREMLLGAARAGLYQPVWSERLLEEWALTGRKFGAEVEAQARGEIALAQAAFPQACQKTRAGIEDWLWLPDPGDLHVLALAVSSSADAIVTANAKDFPRHILAEEGVSRADPDALLQGFCDSAPEAMRALGAEVLATARRLSGEDWTMRALMRKARLPRTGKALERLF